MAQINYDSEVGIAYIYLKPPTSLNISYQDSLFENEDIMLDFDQNNQIVGIEIEGEIANELKRFSGKNHVFIKETVDKEIRYVFRLSELAWKTAARYSSNDFVIFHFSDDQYISLASIEILDVKNYSESFLLGGK